MPEFGRRVLLESCLSGLILYLISDSHDLSKCLVAEVGHLIQERDLFSFYIPDGVLQSDWHS